jgi:SAM-dependent methyltransferase
MLMRSQFGDGARPSCRETPMPYDQRRCDVCDAELRVVFQEVRDPQTGHAFAVSRCPECGLGHTRPQPDDLDEYYGPLYHGGRYGMAERLCIRRRLRFVRAVARPCRLLDFGCGDGAFIAAALAAGMQATGVEMRPEHARSKGLRVVERVEDITGQFDLITLWHSLEHVRSPRNLIGALMQRLSPEGFFVVAVPNADSLQARFFGSSWFHLDVPRHLYHFTPRALRRLLEDCGLVVVRRWNLELEQDLFGWTQSALNRIIRTPNVLFDVVTRRRRRHRPLEIATSLMLGSAVTIAAAPLVPAAAALSRGAVMIFAAKDARTRG